MTADFLRFRLSSMMFGQYLILGCWAVTLATYLMSSPLRGGLGFPPSYTSWVYSTVALSGMIAPIFIGLLADRLFAAEKLMGVLHFVAAVMLTGVAWCCYDYQPRIEAAYRAAAAQERIGEIPLLDMEQRLVDAPHEATPETKKAVREAFARVQASPELGRLLDDTFVTLFLLMFGYTFCYITTSTLSNVVVFRNLPDSREKFGSIRLYGTIGWIVAGVQLELFWNVISAAPLFLAAGFSLGFAVFCFWLPHTPPSGQSKSLGEALGMPALSMFRRRSFCVLIFCSLGIAGVQQFYSIYANRYLNELHAPYPAAVQTLAQVAEVCCMAAIPLCLRTIGLKGTMILGLFGWILRNGLFATEWLPLVVLVGLPLHGLSYAFFILIASMYVDRQAPLHLRASAQGIFTFISMGVGTLLGNWFSARIVNEQTIGDIVAWPVVWLYPTFISIAILFVYVLMFHERDEAKNDTSF